MSLPYEVDTDLEAGDDERCAGINQSGERCGARVLVGEPDEEGRRYCVSHHPDPAVQARKALGAQRGGMSSKLRYSKIKALQPGELGPLNTLADAARQLALVAGAVAEGRLASPQGNAITQAVRAWMTATQAHDDRQTLNAIIKLIEERTAGEGGGDTLAALKRIVGKGPRP